MHVCLWHHNNTLLYCILGIPGVVNNAIHVRNSHSDTLNIYWDILPSLDINDTNPDIVYSVELYEITCGQNILVSHDIVFGNNTRKNIEPLQAYKVVITARNNVERARNGTSVVMRGIL